MSLLSKGTTWNSQTTWNTRKETVLNHAEKLSLEQTLKRNEPHLEKEHEKLSPKNDVFFCVPLCLRSLMPVEDVMYFIYLK